LIGDECLESFFNLRAEKQEHIINAALIVFARNGYKKASIADIAEEAGIAKGMVIYYFGSKKNLYLYLAELCGKIMVEEMEKGFDKSVTDFFDKLKMITDIKIAVIKRHPAVISFLTSLYYETHMDVREEVKQFIANGVNIRGKWIFDGMDITKFKDDVDPKLLERFLVWTGEGMADNIPMDRMVDQIDECVKDYYDCLDLMKRHFYKS